MVGATSADGLVAFCERIKVRDNTGTRASHSLFKRGKNTLKYSPGKVNDFVKTLSKPNGPC